LAERSGGERGGDAAPALPAASGVLTEGAVEETAAVEGTAVGVEALFSSRAPARPVPRSTDPLRRAVPFDKLVPPGIAPSLPAGMTTPA
jgi:hypothetical protein